MESFKSSHAFGLSLVEQGHFAAEEIQENCEEMTLVKDELMETWKEKQVELRQSYELQVCYSSIRAWSNMITVNRRQINLCMIDLLDKRLFSLFCEVCRGVSIIRSMPCHEVLLQ